MAPAEGGLLNIELVFSPAAGEVERLTLQLPAGSVLADAIRDSGLAERHPEVQGLPTGIWGRLQAADALLHEGDRVEVYRPLTVDPKEARRLRYRAQRKAR
jgi:putative ubiquitin-RnfH superfamily antitoxin RatB of RatAB toxin-antitoxin module